MNSKSQLLRGPLDELGLAFLREIRIETATDAIELMLAGMEAERALRGVGIQSSRKAMRKLADTGLRVAQGNARRSRVRQTRRGQ